jgi:hypothetical protein
MPADPRLYDDIKAIETALLETLRTEWRDYGPFKMNAFKLAKTLSMDDKPPLLAVGITEVDMTYFVGGSYPTFRGMVAVVIPFKGTRETTEALWELGQRVAGILTKNANTDLWSDLSIVNIRVHSGEEQPPRWEAVTVAFTLKAVPRRF